MYLDLHEVTLRRLILQHIPQHRHRVLGSAIVSRVIASISARSRVKHLVAFLGGIQEV